MSFKHSSLSLIRRHYHQHLGGGGRDEPSVPAERPSLFMQQDLETDRDEVDDTNEGEEEGEEDGNGDEEEEFLDEVMLLNDNEMHDDVSWPSSSSMPKIIVTSSENTTTEQQTATATDQDNDEVFTSQQSRIKNKKATCWKYFTERYDKKLKKSFTHCNLCTGKLTRYAYSGSTRRMNHHLVYKHNIENIKMTKNGVNENTEIIDRFLLKFLVTSGLVAEESGAVIDNVFFKLFVKMLCSSYKLPTQLELNKLLNEMSTGVRRRKVERLAQADNLALTCAFLQHPSGYYMTLTCHYFDSALLRLNSVPLGAKCLLSASESVECFGKKLIEFLSEFQVLSKVRAIVLDKHKTTANFLTCVNMLKFEVTYCAGQLLQAIVDRAFLLLQQQLSRNRHSECYECGNNNATLTVDENDASTDQHYHHCSSTDLLPFSSSKCFSHSHLSAFSIYPAVASSSSLLSSLFSSPTSSSSSSSFSSSSSAPSSTTTNTYIHKKKKYLSLLSPTTTTSSSLSYSKLKLARNGKQLTSSPSQHDNDDLITRLHRSIDKIRNIFSLFTHDVAFNKLLVKRQKEILLISEQLTTSSKAAVTVANMLGELLALDTPNRWYTTFTMVRNYFELRPCLQPIMLSFGVKTTDVAIGQQKSEHLLPTQCELELLAEYLDALCPLEAFVKTLSEDAYTSSAHVLPCLMTLRETLTHETPFKQALVSALDSLLDDDYGHFLDSRLLMATTFLSPEYKSLTFCLDDKGKKAFLEKARDYIKLVYAKFKLDEYFLRENMYKRLAVTSAQQQCVLDSSNQTKSLCELDAEIESYMADPHVLPNEKSAAYWHRNRLRFPRLVKIFEVIGCVPATCVPSDRYYTNKSSNPAETSEIATSTESNKNSSHHLEKIMIIADDLLANNE